MMTTSRMAIRPGFAMDLGRNVFVGQNVLALRRVRQRLEDEPHRHSVPENAIFDRTLGPDERENARAFVEIDKDLEVWRLEPLRSDACDRVTEQSAVAANFGILHRAVSAASGTHRHFRKDNGVAFIAASAEQTRGLFRISWQH